MQYRHELKFEVNARDVILLRQRLKCLLEPDPHAEGGKYLIRSLYFDTPSDRALKEKVDGVNHREKYRIRYYNGDTSRLRLEKKARDGGFGYKKSAPLTAGDVQALLDGDTGWMAERDGRLIRELKFRMDTELLRPKTIVDYTREPFVYGPGNVRVTLDTGIRTGLSCTDFLNPECVTVPAGDPVSILEVKWDAYLPDIVKAAAGLEDRRASAFSKYARCRIYG